MAGTVFRSFLVGLLCVSASVGQFRCKSVLFGVTVSSTQQGLMVVYYMGESLSVCYG